MAQTSKASTNGGGSSGIEVPVIDLRVSRPSRQSVAWLAGLGAMAAIELIEWPLALIVAAGHIVATQTESPTVREAVEGAESGV